MVHRKRLMGLIVVILIGGSLLQGCGGEKVTEIPTEVPEPVSSEEHVEGDENGEEEDGTPEVQIPDWCVSSGDLKVTLVDLEGFTPEGIDVEVCLPGGAGTYTIETHDLDQGLKDSAIEDIDAFPIATLMGYFEVYAGDPLEQVYEFDPALQLRIIYSNGTWEAALADSEAYDLNRPRVAYLKLNGEVWSDDWVEFNEENTLGIEPIAPGNEGYPAGTGALIIIIESIPDPAIGGC